MAKTKIENISASLPLDMYQTLKKYCEDNDLNIAQVVRRAIKMYFNNIKQEAKQ